MEMVMFCWAYLTGLTLAWEKRGTPEKDDLWVSKKLVLVTIEEAKVDAMVAIDKA
ncbi:hypothetical protein GQL56_28755 [Pseudomonas putida]|nr:hypothetical protein [Pseudomonas putida]